MFFDGCTNLTELKKRYKKLAVKHHPDLGGDTRTMQDVNAEYDALFNRFSRMQNAAAAAGVSGYHETTETPEEFRRIVEILIRLRGIKVELCGCWLWISGETQQHKATLKAAGCKWSRKKQMWSWHHPEDGRFYYRGRRSIDEIRGTYGSATLVDTTA